MMSLELNQSDLNRLIAFAKGLSVASEDDDEDKVSNVLLEFKKWANELGLVAQRPPDHDESGIIKQSDLGKLIAIAKELSVANEDDDEDKVYSVLFGLKEWAHEIGLVSLWSVYCERGGTATPICSWCIADGEDVVSYIRFRTLDHDETGLWWPGDKLLIYPNRSFPPDEPTFIIPVQDKKRKAEVDWMHEGF